jgi:enterochelin esterase-like enzyme
MLLCGAAALMAQPAALTYRSSVDNTDQPYALYLPRTLDRAHKYPLVIGLHEEESNHVLDLKHIFGVISRFGETGLQSLTSFPPMRDQEYIVACPFARGTMGYQGTAERDVYDVMAEVKRRYPVDEDRVYLTGSSMGGGGALWMALTRPDLWAAVAPVCAATIPGSEELAGNAVNLPVRLFHGELDPAVPAESSRQWQRRLLAASVSVDYIEYPGVRHNAWDVAYRNGSIFEWFGKYKRDRDPNHVHFATRLGHYNAAYWVRIDAFAPGALATIDAVREGSAVRVQTKDVDAFTLTAAAKTVTIDGAVMRLRPGAALSFAKAGGKWVQGHAATAALPSGPIVEAVNGRHIYVYGSGDEQGHRNAEAAAAWSTVKVRINLKLPVKSDEEVTDEDVASSNLVLFGNARTNRLIARFAPQLPMELSPGAADYGLLFIAAVGRHYVVVSSGLPWWTGSDEAQRGGYRFAPEQYRLLSTFGDYVLFKGGLKNVLAEGRFDRNGRVPADATAKVMGAGTVSLAR